MNLISLQFYQKMYVKYLMLWCTCHQRIGSKNNLWTEITSYEEWYLCVLHLFYLKQKHIKAFSSETIDQNESTLDFDGLWGINFQNCVTRSCLPSKMAVVTNNRKFFNWPLLYYLSQNELIFEQQLQDNE